MEHVMRNGIPIPVIAGILRLSEKGVKDLSELEGLLELKLLKKLYLGDNQLHSLPEWLGQLQSLQWLYLQNNQLQALLDSSANTTFKELKKKGISIQS
ncbi:MAG: leucine-rich repeat domain-containing protein [Candidatus Lokiarchaeota archaeon]|nr:leucine-rich repeat domain-containing protein [Candidatus Lokiarchaeota archaeon]